ncbi:MAG: DUF262 domain-containing protein [Synergistales bacterium]|nr:DUF262 domain-containing protein [Bacteroidales bacterium]MDY6382032.1 DUF262 domain-containing protein [Bacteroidales bacterium]MDY6434898.1 DUF262 domain-containing protein [Synergistales bacterium]
MEIKLKEITIKDLVKDYVDSQEQGVKALGGKLDVRPAYQREFIYNEKQRDAVITTIMNGFPLNVMYWAFRDDDTEVPFEIIDGQQRTLSICQYANGDFSHDFYYFNNLKDEDKENFLSYKLMVYVCSGTDKEKLNWFRTINIAGVQLTEQELRNAVYSGSWVTSAKTYFSKNYCVAYQIASRYISGSCIRQDYLETAIKWINNNNVEEYMSKHQHDQNANLLWQYFSAVINWVKSTFPHYRNEQKGVNWGELYNKHKDEFIDTNELEKEVSRLMADSDVTNKKGIYYYVFDKEEKHLNIRAFDNNMKRSVYEKQKGECPKCKKRFDIEEMEADHITPWHLGGRTIEDNCQMLCRRCNREKSGK